MQVKTYLKNCHILMGEVHGGGHMYTIHSSSDTHACTACQMMGIKLSAHYQIGEGLVDLVNHLSRILPCTLSIVGGESKCSSLGCELPHFLYVQLVHVTDNL